MENSLAFSMPSPSRQLKRNSLTPQRHRKVMGDVNTIWNSRKSIPASLTLRRPLIEKTSDIGKPYPMKQKSLQLYNAPSVSTSQESIINTDSTSSSVKNYIRLPVLTKPPFLYRNHAAYKYLSTDGTMDDIKYAVSEDSRMEKIKMRKLCRRELQDGSKLECSIVQIKKRILAEYHSEGKWANDILVFEFFKIVSNVDVFEKAYCDVYICGVLNGVTKAQEKLASFCFDENKKQKNPVVEFIPPNPSSHFDELYLYVKAELYAKINMKAKRKIICDHSSTDSSSGTLSYGALCISTKAKNINKGKSQWTTNFKNRGVSLVETNVAKSSDLVKLFQKCQANGRNGGNALSFEISDENGFGCSGTEVIKKGSHLLKKRRKQNDKIVNDKEILYDVSQLIKDNVSWASSSFIRSPQILKSRNKKEYQCTRAVLKKPSSYKNHCAHKENTRTFKCLFCAKTFSNFDLLKFHLENDYPSFNFIFSSSVIKISVDLTLPPQDCEKVKIGTEQLFKNRLESFVEKNVEKELPRSPLLHKRLADFPYKVNTRYSNAPVPRPGLYGHEIPMHFISQSIKIRLNEFEDVEEHEKAFYFLWNSFNAERSNRRLGMLSMNDKLLSFIQKNYDQIEKFNLKSVLNAFLLYFKNVGILNEKQFFTLSFYRTPLENKWFGCNAPLIKK